MAKHCIRRCPACNSVLKRCRCPTNPGIEEDHGAREASYWQDLLDHLEKNEKPQDQKKTGRPMKWDGEKWVSKDG